MTKLDTTFTIILIFALILGWSIFYWNLHTPKKTLEEERTIKYYHCVYYRTANEPYNIDECNNIK